MKLDRRSLFGLVFGGAVGAAAGSAAPAQAQATRLLPGVAFRGVSEHYVTGIVGETEAPMRHWVISYEAERHLTMAIDGDGGRLRLHADMMLAKALVEKNDTLWLDRVLPLSIGDPTFEFMMRKGWIKADGWGSTDDMLDIKHWRDDAPAQIANVMRFKITDRGVEHAEADHFDHAWRRLTPRQLFLLSHMRVEHSTKTSEVGWDTLRPLSKLDLVRGWAMGHEGMRQIDFPDSWVPYFTLSAKGEHFVSLHKHLYGPVRV